MRHFFATVRIAKYYICDIIVIYYLYKNGNITKLSEPNSYIYS